jgi:hypothetical protein
MLFKNRAGQPIEAKSAVAPWSTIIAGYAIWLMFKFWAGARNAFSTPADQQQLIIIVAAVITGVATYVVPHTHRPDLYPVSPPPGYVPIQPAPAPAAPVASEPATESGDTITGQAG